MLYFANHNGCLLSPVVPDPEHNRGLLETMLVCRGEIRLETMHWQRLYSGMQQLSIAIPAGFTPAYLKNEILKSIPVRHAARNLVVRLLVYTRHTAPSFLIRIRPAPLPAAPEQQLICGIVPDLCKDINRYARIKSSNRSLYEAAAHTAQEQGWDDALLLNRYGRIAESTIANIFIVRKGVWYTPPLSEGCVAGVMRRHLLSQRNRYTLIKEIPLSPEALITADMVLLVNSIRGIRRFYPANPAVH